MLAPLPLAALLRRFRDDQGGAFAIVLALALTPLLIVTGVAIDYSRAAQARTEVQGAMDAAVLAGARSELLDDGRAALADDYFRRVLSPEVAAQLGAAQFALDPSRSFVVGSASLAVPTAFAGILRQSTIAYGTRARAAIARPKVKALDLVMCIDATGSMQSTLNAVQANASTFDTALNAEMTARKIAPFDTMRVRVIYYRDFGGNGMTDSPSYVMKYVYKANRSQVFYLSANPYDTASYRNAYAGTYDITRVNKAKPDGTANAEYANYYGEVPALKATGMMSLPAESSAFRAFVGSESASGGGDLPESGLECVNEAMASPWLRVGDRPALLARPLEAVYPVIVTWTDAAAHAPSHPPSLTNPTYPSAVAAGGVPAISLTTTLPPVAYTAGTSPMPRSDAALKDKWSDPAVIDQANKLLVFFGDPNVGPGGTSYPDDGWKKVAAWPGFYLGGTLTQGNTQMVKRIADAVASKATVPTLSQ